VARIQWSIAFDRLRAEPVLVLGDNNLEAACENEENKNNVNDELHHTTIHIPNTALALLAAAAGMSRQSLMTPVDDGPVMLIQSNGTLLNRLESSS